MARRRRSLHHNLQPGENVVFHREHRSKKGRMSGSRWATQKRLAHYRRERKDRLIERRVKTRIREILRGSGENTTA